jgi:hypothetical protein
MKHPTQWFVVYPINMNIRASLSARRITSLKIDPLYSLLTNKHD